ncbi:MAG: 30S ribosomal protein S3 [bacterium]|nr:30S ribosomal protein S3 [bacterium]
MGQKVHPIGFRLGYTKDWEAKWFAKRNYPEVLHEDLKIREFIERRLPYAGISKIIIERFGQKVRVNIHTSRPGIVIGKGGKEVDNLRDELQKLSKSQLQIDIHEIKVPERDARLLAKSITSQLSKRISYRRAMKQAVSQARNAGILGIKVVCSGRLGGQELARTEWYREGRVPLHTLCADIDYGFSEAVTQYGKIGVKVWIFNGEIIGEGKDADAKEGKI